MYSKLVTLIIPCHNAVASLTRTINSLLGQTHKKIQLIIVDNCSTDGSIIVAKDLVLAHPQKIKLIENPNSLTQKALYSQCCNLANGDYTGIFCPYTFYSPRIIEDQLITFNVYKELSCIATHGQIIDEFNIKQNIPCPMNLAAKTVSLMDDKIMLSHYLASGNFMIAPSLLAKSSLYKMHTSFTAIIGRLIEAPPLVAANLIPQKVPGHISSKKQSATKFSPSIFLDPIFRIESSLFFASQNNLGFMSKSYSVTQLPSNNYQRYLEKIRTSKSKLFYFFDAYFERNNIPHLDQDDFNNYTFLLFCDLVYRIKNIIKLRLYSTVPVWSPFQIAIFSTAIKSRKSFQLYIESLFLFCFLKLRLIFISSWQWVFSLYPTNKDPLLESSAYLNSPSLKSQVNQAALYRSKISHIEKLLPESPHKIKIRLAPKLIFDEVQLAIIAPSISDESFYSLKAALDPFILSSEHVLLATSLKKAPKKLKNYLSKNPQFKDQVLDLRGGSGPNVLDLYNICYLVSRVKKSSLSSVFSLGTKAGVYGKIICSILKCNFIYSPESLPFNSSLSLRDWATKHININLMRFSDYLLINSFMDIPSYQKQIPQLKTKIISKLTDCPQIRFAKLNFEVAKANILDPNAQQNKIDLNWNLDLPSDSSKRNPLTQKEK